jgi:hypothetical protein
MSYREPGEAGTLLLAPLAGPAHVGAGGALGGQRTTAPAQALRRTRRTRVTLRKEMINTFKAMSAGKIYHVCRKKLPCLLEELPCLLKSYHVC